MATFASQYLENALLNWFRGTTFPVVPGTMYLAAFTVAPNSAGGGTEVSGGSYARLAIVPNTTNWGAPTNAGNTQLIKNAVADNFVAATASWGTIVGVGLFDALTSGNLLWYGDLVSPIVISNTFQLVFPINNISVTAD